MPKFILGYESDNSTELRLYETEQDADENSEQWCTVEALSLEAAKENYETAFEAWEREFQQRHNPRK